MLAAGLGTRLRPLTDIVPKALCPVLNRPLLDWAIERVASVTRDVAVNAHHHAELVAAHVGSRAHLSIEQPAALGTAGAIGRLRGWLDGRAVVVTNADAWGATRLNDLLDGWDGRCPRVLVVPVAESPDFAGPSGSAGTGYRFAGASLLPAATAASLGPVPSGLYETVWRQAEAAGKLEFVVTRKPFFDCGTPADYLAANLCASGGESVVGAGAVVDGHIERCVVWANGHVDAHERLADCIRVGRDLTVDGRPT